MGLLGTLVALRLLIWLVYRGGSGLMLSRAAAITNGRYCVIALFDMWSNVFASDCFQCSSHWFRLWLVARNSATSQSGFIRLQEIKAESCSGRAKKGALAFLSDMHCGSNPWS
jgi:hypothetical protein